MLGGTAVVGNSVDDVDGDINDVARDSIDVVGVDVEVGVIDVTPVVGFDVVADIGGIDVVADTSDVGVSGDVVAANIKEHTHTRLKRTL